MSRVETKISNGKFKVCSDYNKQFVDAARKMGGKWDGVFWVFDERNMQIVKSTLFDIYGDDGESTPDTVSIKIRYPEKYSVTGDSVSVLGKVIAKAYGRDSGARLGDNVVMLQGDIRSGGSVKNWQTIVEADSIFIVHDFPRGRVSDITSCEVLEIIERKELPNPPVIDRNALVEERERILKRLQEIDSLLSVSPNVPSQEIIIPEELKD